MTRELAMAAALAAVSALGSVAAQQPFHTETRLVVLYVAVKNSHGGEVADLNRQAFTVFENGRRQPITLFRRDDVPVSIGLLLDNSGSMRALRERVEKAALTFVRASNPLDEVFVVNFADKPRLDVPVTSDEHTLESGIARVDSIGGTALRDAIEMSEHYLREHASRDRRLLLVITDGRDNASTVTVRQIQDVSQRSNTSVYAIGLFNASASVEANTGRHDLDALTGHTGGAAYYPASVDSIETVVTDLAHQIRNQYTIAYTPANQALDGSYRRIRVEAHGREPLTVRTRAGYIASPPADGGR